MEAGDRLEITEVYYDPTSSEEQAPLRVTVRLTGNLGWRCYEPVELKDAWKWWDDADCVRSTRLYARFNPYAAPYL